MTIKNFIFVSCFLFFFKALGFQAAQLNQMSDAQFSGALERAQSAGYTPEQIEQMARDRGLSEENIDKLRERANTLGKETGEGLIQQTQLREEIVSLNLDPWKFDDTPLSVRQLKEERVFGSEMFNNKLLTFAPSQNIPTPRDYQLGPGDELIIDIWGASENTFQLTIDAEGRVKIPKIGPIYINGLSIADASTRLLSRLSKIYGGLKNNQFGVKNTWAQVSLGRMRSIRVNVIGEVEKPGTYTISSLSTIMHVLYQAGGPSGNGSYRKIEILRRGVKVDVFDIYDYLLRGDMNINLNLEEQDVVRIPVYQKRIKIKGAIKTQGYYQLKEDESLDDILLFSGGFNDAAYTDLLTIHRKTSKAREILDIPNHQFDQVSLKSGDVIEVNSILGFYENRVTIKGAVWRPGDYELTDGLMLSDLIDKADGLKDEAFMELAQIKRYNENRTLKNIDFDLKEIIDGKTDISLLKDDVVIVTSIFELRDRYTIQIQGEIRNPQTITFEDSLKVEDLILMAGGFRESAAKSFIEVARKVPDSGNNNKTAIIYNFPIDESLSLRLADSKFILEPFDIVSVRRSPSYHKPLVVEIEGQVQYPGKYVLELKEERISDLINRSQGLTNLAYPTGATLIRKSELFLNSGTDNENFVRLKRSMLGDVLSSDSTLNELDRKFRPEEMIGIDLNEILRKPGGKQDLVLKSGDVVSIPIEPTTVRVRGEVLHPGQAVFAPIKGFRSLLSVVGGTTSDAHLRKSYVIYPNGSARKTRSFLGFKSYPPIEPGAEVIIPAKPQRNRPRAQEIIGLSTALLSMIILIDRLTAQ